MGSDPLAAHPQVGWLSFHGHSCLEQGPEQQEVLRHQHQGHFYDFILTTDDFHFFFFFSAKVFLP